MIVYIGDECVVVGYGDFEFGMVCIRGNLECVVDIDIVVFIFYVG